MQKFGRAFAARPFYGKRKFRVSETQEVSDKILTIPNVISFIRLCMVPAFVVLLLGGNNVAATVLFAVAASTDFVDGQIARRTNSVSKLGQLLDPAVDRILMISGVICVLIVGRLPLWVVVFVIARDLFLLAGAAYLLRCYHKRVAVIYPGKVSTTLLFVGFAMLLLNWPLVSGLGWCDIAWLPGFSVGTFSCGIWFVYAGLLLSAFVTVYYVVQGFKARREARAEEVALRSKKGALVGAGNSGKESENSSLSQ